MNSGINNRKKQMAVIIGIIIFGIVCFCTGYAYSNFSQDNTGIIDDGTELPGFSFDVFSSVGFEGMKETADIPWKYTAGVFDMDFGESILLTPNTAVSMEREDIFESWAFQYKIHPWVSKESDGAGLVIWILDEEGSILYSEDLFVSNEDEWQDYCVNLGEFEKAKEIKILCNNGLYDNDECDWVVIRKKKSESVAFGENYVRSATYFADEWPINFWNSEMEFLEEDFEQIKADGFDSIILVIPWREFQPTLSPISYNEYAFENLNRIMAMAAKTDLNVYARIGYLWDFFNDENDNIADRFFGLLGDSDVLSCWDDYIAEMHKTLSTYDCFKGAFLTWEDFWNSLGVCDIQEYEERLNKSWYMGYGKWDEGVAVFGYFAQ